MKHTLFTLAMLIGVASFAQDRFPNHDSLEKQIKVNREGKGNSTFDYTLPKLKGIVKVATLKSLESQLSNWRTYASDNNIGYEFNDETRNHDIPLYQVQYETTINNKHYVLRTQVPGSLDNKIKKLEVIVTLNGMELAKFKESLRNSGYLLNEKLSKIFRKETWQKKGNPTITIKENANGTSLIGAY